MKESILVLHTGGSGAGDLLVESLHSSCGGITNGVMVRFRSKRGVWVIERADLLRLARMLRESDGPE